jgi:hypothetical protein
MRKHGRPLQETAEVRVQQQVGSIVLSIAHRPVRQTTVRHLRACQSQPSVGRLTASPLAPASFGRCVSDTPQQSFRTFRYQLPSSYDEAPLVPWLSCRESVIWSSRACGALPW